MPLAVFSRPTRYALAAALLGCDTTAPEPPSESELPELPGLPVATVSLSPDHLALVPEQTATLTITTKVADGRAVAGRVARWESSDPAVATVTEAGIVRGVAEGTATITATVDEATGTTTVTVIPEELTTLLIQPGSMDLLVTRSFQLSLVGLDGAGQPVSRLPPVRWSSRDSSVASVDAQGRISGRAPGTTQIWATVDGAFFARATIRVVQLNVVGDWRMDEQYAWEVSPAPLGICRASGLVRLDIGSLPLEGEGAPRQFAAAYARTGTCAGDQGETALGPLVPTTDPEGEADGVVIRGDSITFWIQPPRRCAYHGVADGYPVTGFRGSIFCSATVHGDEDPLQVGTFSLTRTGPGEASHARVDSFYVVEHRFPGDSTWYYAPRLFLSSTGPGRVLAERIEFEIPGFGPVLPVCYQDMYVEVGRSRDVFPTGYGDYSLSYYKYHGERADPGDVHVTVVYRDEFGKWGRLEFNGPVVAGGPPAYGGFPDDFVPATICDLPFVAGPGLARLAVPPGRNERDRE